ncbi:protein yellow-like [Argopecten irradians]|uniref:protein yellow-like n=1 Tax=Argopecten irradians TaxID=31199 RepID=UPI00371F4056
MTSQYIHVLLFLSLSGVFTQNISTQHAEIVYSWKTVDYSWPTDTLKQAYIATEQFVVENNIICGIKVLDGNVYVTVPRWKPGVPSTLNKVITDPGNGNESILEPFPNWAMQTVGDCNALQYVQSMEVDPNTGYMWIIDTGRIHTSTNEPQNICPAKLIVYDVRNNQLVHVHEFPENVASRTSTLLNDLVLDYVNGAVEFVYITDNGQTRLIVYNHKTNTSYFFQHPSMKEEPGIEVIIGVNKSEASTRQNINGIAMTYDFKFVYYYPLQGYSVYKVSTSVLRNQSSNFSVDFVGRKNELTGGMVASDKALYNGGASSDAVYKLPRGRVDEQITLISDPELRVDTLAIDVQQNLWLVANSLDLFMTGTMNFSETNIHIWKIAMDENVYLYDAQSRTVR